MCVCGEVYVFERGDVSSQLASGRSVCWIGPTWCVCVCVRVCVCVCVRGRNRESERELEGGREGGRERATERSRGGREVSCCIFLSVGFLERESFVFVVSLVFLLERDTAHTRK